MGKKQPAHEIKLGKVRATIWANESEDHDLWFNATVSRVYKNGEGWRETNTLRRDDLPLAMKAIDMAYTWMWRKQVQLQKAERNAANQVLAGERRPS